MTVWWLSRVATWQLDTENKLSLFRLTVAMSICAIAPASRAITLQNNVICEKISVTFSWDWCMLFPLACVSLTRKGPNLRDTVADWLERSTCNAASRLMSSTLTPYSYYVRTVSKFQGLITYTIALQCYGNCVVEACALLYFLIYI